MRRKIVRFGGWMALGILVVGLGIKGGRRPLVRGRWASPPVRSCG